MCIFPTYTIDFNKYPSGEQSLNNLIDHWGDSTGAMEKGNDSSVKRKYKYNRIMDKINNSDEKL